jgi:hypothetical protein
MAHHAKPTMKRMWKARAIGLVATVAAVNIVSSNLAAAGPVDVAARGSVAEERSTCMAPASRSFVTSRAATAVTSTASNLMGVD